MVPKTNINWKGFKNRAIGNQFPPTPNKLKKPSAFLRAAENPLNSSERLGVDQSCECMSWNEGVVVVEGGGGGNSQKQILAERRCISRENPTGVENWASVRSRRKNREHLSSCRRWLFWATGEVPPHHYRAPPPSCARNKKTKKQVGLTPVTTTDGWCCIRLL